MKNDKYGVIMYKYTDNLGDDIQTYAASKLLPRVDYIIDREKLSEFIPKKSEVVKVIMNGWFNHDKTNFLISPYIYPLLISMHFSKNDLILNPGHKFLEGYAKKVLTKYGELGCRDINTMNDLKQIGYNTYFSSCVTTTINKEDIKTMKEKKYICAVDLKPNILNHLKDVLDIEIKETTHWLIFDNPNLNYQERQKVIEEYTKKDFEERKKYVQAHANLTFEERMKLVEKQLELYKNSSLVITDRIHVALPCLAMKVPVLFVYYEHNKDRVETFTEFLTCCNENQILEYTKEELMKVKNSNRYEKYRKSIIKRVNEFMNEDIPKDLKKVPSIHEYKDFIERMNYLKEMYVEKILTDKENINQKEKKIQELYQINNEIKNEYKTKHEEQQQVIDEYNRIKNSRTWKIIGKYYNRKKND